MLLAFSLALLCTVPQESADAQPPALQWTFALDWLRGESAGFAQDLKEAKQALLARADVEDPAVARLLRGTPPPIVERGYQVLPRLLNDEAFAAVTPRKTVYSLEDISTAYTWAVRDAAVLARIAVEQPGEELAPLADRYERLRQKHRNLEEHIAYHAFWQVEVIGKVSFFAERNEILALIEEWNNLRTSGGDPASLAALQEQWGDRLAPFTPTPGLALERRDDGSVVLAVTVATDIVDEAFLTSFEQAVEDAFSTSDAARERRFTLELTIERVAPADLYPEGAPERGAQIDERDHRARFRDDALVLTSGGKSTHSYVGRTIQLGSTPLPPRTLAHEFGHLLGFRDAYLRAFTGDPRAPFGAKLVEWTGILQDLMGDAKRGRVTVQMIDRLVGGYGG